MGDFLGRWRKAGENVGFWGHLFEGVKGKGASVNVGSMFAVFEGVSERGEELQPTLDTRSVFPLIFLELVVISCVMLQTPCA